MLARPLGPRGGWRRPAPVSVNPRCAPGLRGVAVLVQLGSHGDSIRGGGRCCAAAPADLQLRSRGKCPKFQVLKHNYSISAGQSVAILSFKLSTFNNSKIWDIAPIELLDRCPSELRQ